MPIGPASVRAEGSTREAVKEFFAAEAKNSDKIRRHTLGLAEDEDLPPYTYEEYPKAMYPYDAGDEPIVVANEAQEQARLEDGYFSTLAEARAHYTMNGDSEEGDGDDDDGEILAVAGTDQVETSPPPVRRPAAKRRRPARRKRT